MPAGVHPAPGYPWIHKIFLKDTGKLRPGERYWQPFGDEAQTSVLETRNAALGLVREDDQGCMILPDAICVRKYLRLFKHILSQQQGQHLPNSRWLLLESVVEYMDYRNQAPVIQSMADDDIDGEQGAQSEMAAPQERSTLQKLAREGKILPFCDLSVRRQDVSGLTTDEWEWIGYETLSIEERSRNSLLRAGRLLQEEMRRVSKQYVKVIVLVDQDDASSAEGWDELQMEEGIQVEHVQRYLETLATFLDPGRREQLNHLLQSCQEEYNKRNTPKKNTSLGDQEGLENEYWSDERVSEGLRNGTLFRGRLNFTKENPKEAFVRVDGKHWFVDAHAGHHNRAIHQDIVVLRPLPEDEWGRPVGRRRLVFVKDNDDDAGMDDDEYFSFPTFPSAHVVAIHAMARRSFAATMVDTPLPEESAALLVPMDIRVPKIRLPTKSWQKFVGMRLLVQVDGWDIGSNYPHGHAAEILGPIGDLETEIQCLLCENEVRLDPFSLAARACLPSEGAAWTIPEPEINQRRDLRNTHQIFSVDPVGCQDIDDTMHACHLPNGDVEIGVHIADVTWFVPLDSALDREARIRGTTFYLVDRRFDMLPGLLSSNLCSLHGGTDRLAVSVVWTLSPDMKRIKSTWFGRTVIHNVAAMTYEQAANILEGKKPETEGGPLPPLLTAGAPVNPKLIHSLKEDLGLLTKLARLRRKRREDEGGAIDLSSGDIGGELKFTLVNGKPVSVKPKKDMEIHHTIAELMIWANTSVASKIYEVFPGSALLRIHQDVEEERFDDLREMLSAGKLELQGKTNMELAETLKRAEHSSVPVVASLFRSLATRAMSEAQYISTGDRKEGQNLSHYGLGLSVYTHFTSPIRRYADIVVHHQLLAALTTTKPAQIKGTSAQERPLPSLPESRVISMLDEASGAPGYEITTSGTASKSVVTHDKKVVNVIGTAFADEDDEDFDIDGMIRGAAELIVGNNQVVEVPGVNEISSPEDLEIDDLIFEAADLLTGELVSGNDGHEVDVEVDTLVDGAAKLVEVSERRASPVLDPDIDALIDGAADLLIGDFQEIQNGAETQEDLEIDDLVGGAGESIISGKSETINGVRSTDLGVGSPVENGPSNTAVGSNITWSGVLQSTTGSGSPVVIDHEAKGTPNITSLSRVPKGGLDDPRPERGPSQADSVEVTPPPFFGNQVSTICERLNLHNRLAKQCSFECQSLFLSLFFKDHVEVTEAVVVNTKENGFMAYVPRFDLRAPVYLRDSDGFVQMDPALLGLPKDSGEKSTVGFAWSDNCRRFPRDEVELDLVDETLEVRSRAASRTLIKIGPLDVVNVEIFCSDWDQRARIPTPRLHLVHSHTKKISKGLALPELEPVRSKKDSASAKAPSVTIFDILQVAAQSPERLQVSRKPQKKNAVSRTETLRGRIVFGDFANPNTRQASQLVAQQEAAAEAAERRRNYATKQASRRNEDFSTTRRIEREVTTRQQRLAKEKRETRRAKKT